MEHIEHVMRGGTLDGGAVVRGYMPGFNNTHSTEAEEGTLPMGRNSPQRPRHGLYGEQLSGTAFTAPRHENKRSWLYRILPSVRHGTGYTEVDSGQWRTAPHRVSKLPAMQLRWQPLPLPEQGEVDFLAGLRTITTCGDASLQCGIAAHVYVANAPMVDAYLQCSDGELLVLPQQGAVRFVTELGVIEATPGEAVVIPRGVRFRVELLDGPVRGYVCENYGTSLTLPERGPIGANCLANSRDFLYPVAAYEDRSTEATLYCKSQGRLFKTTLAHSPLDVVAWHGNYAPYKYDLRRFSPVGSILFDHPDPSIFTVLTAPSAQAGTPNMDFVIFPDRWLVMEDTFRPPWYHMNVMSEFMGLLYGVYDAKPGGFKPGGMSLHNALVPHGPDSEAYTKATNADLKPDKLAGTMAFMFETRYVQDVTAYASDLDLIDLAYSDCWADLQRNFSHRDQG